MPIRIYALAKELKIDSKELVEVCTKAGIPGKGSALASLDDDEVAKVKSYLSGPKPAATKPSAPTTAAAPSPPPAATPPKREDSVLPKAGGKIRVLGGKAKSAEKPAARAKDHPARAGRRMVGDRVAVVVFTDGFPASVVVLQARPCC